jgi:hypothetical protein
VPTLVASNAENPVARLQLLPGINTIGRAGGNHHTLPHASISSRHCEIVVKEKDITVRDLSSTNGTFIDQVKVEGQAPLSHGQSLRLGDLEFVLDAPDKVIAKAGNLRMTVPAVAPSEPPPPVHTAAEVIAAIEPDLNDGPSYYRQIPATFAYPFKQNGRILLFLGTLFLALIDGGTTGSMGPLAGVFSLVLRVSFTGYVFAFMQSVIQHTAQGEDAMPDFPEFSSWWSDIMLPFLLFAVTILVSFFPAIVVPRFFASREAKEIAVLASLVCGAFYFPMALLAVAITDNIIAVSPHVVLRSIARVFVPYLVTFVMLAALIGIRWGAAFAAGSIPNQPFAIRIVIALLMSFVSLYLLTVEMRLLGLLFRKYRPQLGWI